MKAKLMVYLSAKYSRREEMARCKRQLESSGLIEVTNRWCDGDDRANPEEMVQLVQDGLGGRFASEDIKNIEAAHVVICFTEERGTWDWLGDRHVELGIALAHRRKVFVVGPRENVFHHLAQVRVCPDWGSAISVLIDMATTYCNSRG